MAAPRSGRERRPVRCPPWLQFLPPKLEKVLGLSPAWGRERAMGSGGRGRRRDGKQWGMHGGGSGGEKRSGSLPNGQVLLAPALKSKG